MNQKSLELLEKYVPKSYITQAHQTQQSHENEIRILLEKAKIPEDAWPEQRIELFLNSLSLMDSNNFNENCGLGEREGRVFSKLVSERNFHFSHGIGRSGDLIEVQPKAIGSSVLHKLTNELVLDLAKQSGLQLAKGCVIMPMATGMTMAFCMMSIRQEKPQAKYVLMPRIDQKSCIKSILTAGFQPVIIEPLHCEDELCTNLEEIENQISQLKPENIACVLSTTSCFAPRTPDKVEEIANLCQKQNIYHLINNAYGLQSSKLTHMINQAARSGRVDMVVQSTDKNLMVPVGGAILIAFDEKKLENISQFYPGRASFAQTLDVLITFLEMGLKTYKQLLNERKECYNYLKTQLTEVAKKFNEKVLETPANPISMAFTLSNFGINAKDLTQIGSMLFTRNVSGVRVVVPGESKEIGGHVFESYGSHSSKSNCAYFTAAAAIGIQKSEIDLFIKRLEKVLQQAKEGKTSNNDQ